MAASGRFRLPPPLPFFLLVVCLAAVPDVQAQRVAVSRWGVDDTATSVVRETSVLDLATGQIVARAPRAAGHDPVFTADGRYLVFDDAATAPPSTLVVLDLRSGGETLLPSPFVPYTAHPRVTAVFGSVNGAPARLDLAGLQTWTSCGTDAATAMDVSADGSTVAVICGTRLLELDATSGGVRRLVTVPAGGTGVRLLPGSEALVVSGTGVDRYDLATGQVLASRAGVSSIGPAGARDAVAASFCVGSPPPRATFFCRAAVIDSQTLADRSPLADLGVASRVATTTDRGSLFAHGSFLVTAQSELRLVDVATGTTVASAFRALNTYAGQLASPPSTPTLAAPQVAGGTVSLTWTLAVESTAVTGYRLEAGYAPGTTAVSLDLGPAPAASIPGVPPGRYYARIRAVNDNGISAPSNEIVIDVP